ncbi:MAG: fructosamine kinase family protein [Actinomycetaceae bacterium]|nr:fructosamine kinase family protein [Actinomycetaceae bacterium]
MRSYTKYGTPEALEFEAAGLRALKAAESAGGAQVCEILSASDSCLETGFIETSAPTQELAEDFGRRLAATHAYCPSGTRLFGEAPAEGVTGFMGRAPLPLLSAGAPARSWGEFYADDRLMPYVSAAVNNGSLDSRGVQIIERLCERLRDGDFDAPQPAMVASGAALLHGDLWSGNIMWSRDGGVLIDPACHGGHAESDLAQLTVFGAPFVETIYSAYNEASPLADGFRERIGLHTLHMLIVHAALFGGGYGRQTVVVASTYI